MLSNAITMIQIAMMTQDGVQVEDRHVGHGCLHTFPELTLSDSLSSLGTEAALVLCH